jgi:hypothetical protein
VPWEIGSTDIESQFLDWERFLPTGLRKLLYQWPDPTPPLLLFFTFETSFLHLLSASLSSIRNGLTRVRGVGTERNLAQVMGLFKVAKAQTWLMRISCGTRRKVHSSSEPEDHSCFSGHVPGPYQVNSGIMWCTITWVRGVGAERDLVQVVGLFEVARRGVVQERQRGCGWRVRGPERQRLVE